MKLNKVLMKPLLQETDYCEKCHGRLIEKNMTVKCFLQGNLEKTKYVTIPVWYCNSNGCLYGKIYSDRVKKVDKQQNIWIFFHESNLWRLLSENRKTSHSLSKKKNKKHRGMRRTKKSITHDSYGRFIPDIEFKKKYDWGEDQ